MGPYQSALDFRPLSFCMNQVFLIKIDQTIEIFSKGMSAGVYGPINVTEDLNSIADYYMYGHCVKVIGWGVETYNWPGVRLNDQSWSTRVPYWLIANSWGRDWGERGKNGISSTRGKI